MGLDQYAGTMRTETYEYKTPEGEKKVDEYQIAGPFQWRKHARLQEFMNQLYMERNNVKHKWEELAMNEDSDEIYWNPVSWDRLELSEDDINLLEKAINSQYSSYFCDGGCFWGHEIQEYQADYYKEQDLKFVEFARKALENGETVIYECSW
jgi:hypothetical protein